MAFNYQKELEAHGFKGDVEDFRDIIAEVKNTLYPNWTDEVLVLHSEEAMEFCQEVRRRAKAKDRLETFFINSALFNIRKSHPERLAD